MRKVTTRPGESSAAACRRKKWKVGDRLVGDEGYGPDVIELTAIGECLVLAKCISRRGSPVEAWDSGEHTWTLSCRDWKKVRRS